MARHRALYPVEYASPVSPGGDSIVASHTLMPEALYHDKLLAVGFDDLGILQITLIASWFNYINRVADALPRRAWEERRLVSARLISFVFVCRPITTQLEGIYATTSAENRIGVIAPVPALVRCILHRHAPEPGIF